MRLIDRIALNRLVSIIVGFVISIAKIFANTKNKDEVSPSKPNRPKPLKRIVDIIPFPWRNK